MENLFGEQFFVKTVIAAFVVIFMTFTFSFHYYLQKRVWERSEKAKASSLKRNKQEQAMKFVCEKILRQARDRHCHSPMYASLKKLADERQEKFKHLTEPTKFQFKNSEENKAEKYHLQLRDETQNLWKPHRSKNTTVQQPYKCTNIQIIKPEKVKQHKFLTIKGIKPFQTKPKQNSKSSYPLNSTENFDKATRNVSYGVKSLPNMNCNNNGPNVKTFSLSCQCFNQLKNQKETSKRKKRNQFTQCSVVCCEAVDERRKQTEKQRSTSFLPNPDKKEQNYTQLYRKTNGSKMLIGIPNVRKCDIKRKQRSINYFVIDLNCLHKNKDEKVGTITIKKSIDNKYTIKQDLLYNPSRVITCRFFKLITRPKLVFKVFLRVNKKKIILKIMLPFFVKHNSCRQFCERKSSTDQLQDTRIPNRAEAENYHMQQNHGLGDGHFCKKSQSDLSIMAKLIKTFDSDLGTETCLSFPVLNDVTVSKECSYSLIKTQKHFSRTNHIFENKLEQTYELSQEAIIDTKPVSKNIVPLLHVSTEKILPTIEEETIEQEDETNRHFNNYKNTEIAVKESLQEIKHLTNHQNQTYITTGKNCAKTEFVKSIHRFNQNFAAVGKDENVKLESNEMQTVFNITATQFINKLSAQETNSLKSKSLKCFLELKSFDVTYVDWPISFLNNDTNNFSEENLIIRKNSGLSSSDGSISIKQLYVRHDNVPTTP